MANPELKPIDVEALTRIHTYEQTMADDSKQLGWSWQDVQLYPATINKLLIAGLIELKYSSNRYKNYMLTEKGRNFILNIGKAGTIEEQEQLDVSGLFSEVVGYDDLKELLREVLLAEDVIHVLLYGPPSIAKSMFLMDIERAAGSRSLPLLGSSTSHAGMWDLIVDRRPKFILIDEIEKMQLADMAGLLSLMESRRIIRAKVGRMLEETLDTRVIAAANRISRLPPELLSRFWKYQLAEYGAVEFVMVVESVLKSREHLDDQDAKEIAQALVGRSHDVRDAIRVARLSKRVGVERSLQLFCKQ